MHFLNFCSSLGLNFHLLMTAFNKQSFIHSSLRLVNTNSHNLIFTVLKLILDCLSPRFRQANGRSAEFMSYANLALYGAHCMVRIIIQQ